MTTQAITPEAAQPAAKPAVKTAAKAAAKPAAAKPAARPAAKRASSRSQGAGLPENHTASEAIAYAIVTLHVDLAPSVNRIMGADLEEPSRLVAISLFQASLDTPGDPYRFPVNAIEGGRLMVALPDAE